MTHPLADPASVAALPPGVLPEALEEAIARYVGFVALLRSAGAGDAIIPRYSGVDRDHVIGAFLETGDNAPMVAAIDHDLRRLHREPGVSALFARPKRARWRRWIERRTRVLLRRSTPTRIRLPRMREVVPEGSRVDRQEEANRRFVAALDRQCGAASDLAQVAVLARLIVPPGEACRIFDAIQASPARTASLIRVSLAFASPFDDLILPIAIWRAVAAGDIGTAADAALRLLDVAPRPVAAEAVEALCFAAIELGDTGTAHRIAAAWQAAAPGDKVAVLTAACVDAVDDPRAALATVATWPADDPDLAGLRALWRLRLGDPDGAEHAVRAALPSELDRMRTDRLYLLDKIYLTRGDPSDFAATALALEGDEVRWGNRRSTIDFTDLTYPATSAATLVTVLLDARQAKPAAATMTSILAQSHAQIELFVIGQDALMDDTPADERIRHVTTAGEALAAARGDLIALATPGTIWLRNRLVAHVLARTESADTLFTISRGLRATSSGTLSCDARARFRWPDADEPVIDRSLLERLHVSGDWLANPGQLRVAIADTCGDGAITTIESVLAIAFIPQGDEAEDRPCARPEQAVFARRLSEADRLLATGHVSSARAVLHAIEADDGPSWHTRSRLLPTCRSYEADKARTMVDQALLLLPLAGSTGAYEELCEQRRILLANSAPPDPLPANAGT